MDVSEMKRPDLALEIIRHRKLLKDRRRQMAVLSSLDQEKLLEIALYVKPEEEPAVEWTAEDIRNAFAPKSSLTKDTDDSSLSKLLDKWAAIPTSLKVGDVVRLKSGGPAMTVTGFDEKQGWDCSYMVKGERHPVGGYFPRSGA